MTHRTALATIAALALSATVAAAQPPQDAPDFDRGRRSEQKQADRLEKMTEFLDLSDAQALEVESIFTEQRQTRQALFGSMRSVQAELQALLEADAPDPAQVGTKAIELHQMRQTLRSQGEQETAALRDVLTPEQAEKLDTMIELREMSRDRGPRDQRGPRGRRDRRTGPSLVDG